MSVKFVAYTQEHAEGRGGVYYRHVITPVDTDNIPQDVQDMFPGNIEAQIQYCGVEPEFLDFIAGVFDTYPQASEALQSLPIWRKYKR